MALLLLLPRDALHQVCWNLSPHPQLRLLTVSRQFRTKLRSAPLDLSPDAFGDRYLTCATLQAALLSLRIFQLTGVGLCDDFELDLIDGSDEEDEQWIPEARWRRVQPCYARVLQRHGDTLRVLDLTEYPGPDLDVCLACTGLRTLGLRSISAVTCLRQLTTLTLGGCPSVCLEPLGQCHRLRILGIEYDSPLAAPSSASVQMLRSCTELRELNLRNWAALREIGALSNCRELEILELPNSAVHDLAPICGCAKLKMLNLFGCKHLRDLSSLAQLPRLHTLDLTEAASVSGLGWVGDCGRDIELFGVLVF